MDYFQFHNEADNEEVEYRLTYPDLKTPQQQTLKFLALLDQVGSMLTQIDTKDDLEVLAKFLFGVIANCCLYNKIPG